MRISIKQIIFTLILLFAFCLVVFTQKKTQKYPKKPPSVVKEAGSTKDVNKIFEVLFYGLDLPEKQVKAKPLQFSKSTEQDILAFLKNFPVDYNDLANDLSFEKKYRFVQAYYENYFIVFKLGNEPNLWKNKLCHVSFNITFPDEEIAEDKTKVFRKLKQLYGKNTRTEKFRYASNDESELNLYIWKFPLKTITYRSYYDSETRKTAVVVEYWDSKFYKAYPYYDLD